MSSMSSSRPYLLRAIYEWIVDNQCTPHILVDTRAPGVEVPQQYVNKDGQIVLNIAPSAVAHLHMGQDDVVFNARFGGIPTDVRVPIHAILGVYARENGQGMLFEPEAPPEPEPAGPGPVGVSGSGTPMPAGARQGPRPSLKVVK